MRFAIVVVAGLIGWLWFATREPDASTSAGGAPARRADLADLHAQVAAAARAPRAAAAIEPIAIDDDDISIETAAEAATDHVGEARNGDLSELAAQLEAAAERDVEDPVDVPEDDEPIGHEVIEIIGSAPIIDPTTTTSGCYTIELEYTRNIPVPGRTFEGVLGAAADSQSQDDGVTFSSGGLIENTYILEERAVDVPAEDDVIIEERAVDVPAEGDVIIED